MDAIIYLLADLYPWWGIPLALIVAETANHHRRHRNRKKMIIYAVISAIFFGLAGAYFAFNGIERMRPAMQNLERIFLKQK